MPARDIDNNMDVIDSRDVIARIDELESWRDDAQTNAQDLKDKIAELTERLTANTMGDDERAKLLGELADKQDEIAALEFVEEDEGDDKKTVYLDSFYDESAHEELITLKALADEAEGSGDWRHGESLIRDSYFKTYAQELADDIGAINKDSNWPNNCIDWDRAADELLSDYTSVEFGDVTYWIRS